MHQIVVDAGPFIHLSQVNEITILKRFPIIYTSTKIISEISPAKGITSSDIRKWTNLKIFHITEKASPKIEKVCRQFSLHLGEKDVLILASKFSPSIILTDDLDARTAAESLEIEAHGTIGIISYAFFSKWISYEKAEEIIYLIYKKSSLFITTAIVERAIQELRKHS